MLSSFIASNGDDPINHNEATESGIRYPLRIRVDKSSVFIILSVILCLHYTDTIDSSYLNRPGHCSYLRVIFAGTKWRPIMGAVLAAVAAPTADGDTINRLCSDSTDRNFYRCVFTMQSNCEYLSTERVLMCGV